VCAVQLSQHHLLKTELSLLDSFAPLKTPLIALDSRGSPSVSNLCTLLLPVAQKQAFRSASAGPEAWFSWLKVVLLILCTWGSHVNFRIGAVSTATAGPAEILVRVALDL
jgi:hypothetical protein